MGPTIGAKVCIEELLLLVLMVHYHFEGCCLLFASCLASLGLLSALVLLLLEGAQVVSLHFRFAGLEYSLWRFS